MTQDTDRASPPGLMRRPRLWLMIGAVVLLILAVVLLVMRVGGDVAADAPGPRQFPDRAAAQPLDQERGAGQEAGIGGIKATVTTSARLRDFEGDVDYLVVRASFRNDDQDPRALDPADFHLETPAGEQVPAAEVTATEALTAGPLAAGEEKGGRLFFEIGDAAGTFYVVWAPAGDDGPRGVWPG